MRELGEQQAGEVVPRPELVAQLVVLRGGVRRERVGRRRRGHGAPRPPRTPQRQVQRDVVLVRAHYAEERELNTKYTLISPDMDSSLRDLS